MQEYCYGIVVQGKPLFIYAESRAEAKRKLRDEFKIDVDELKIPIDRLQ